MSSRSRIPIRSWRVCEAEPHGLQMWFDPRTERPRLYTLGSREQIPGAGVASSDEEDDLFDRVVQDPSETLIEVRLDDPQF